MDYTIIYTNADGTKTTATTTAFNTKQAHENARHLITDTAKGFDTLSANKCATVRVYPTTQDNNGNIIAYNVLRGALQVAKKSAEKATANGGTDTQFRIANELTGANAKAGTECAERAGAGYILELIARCSADAQEFVSSAYEGMLNAINEGESITEQYHRGYLSVNAHIMSQRTARQKEVSTEYIEENGGELVSINQYIAHIVSGEERYTPIATGIMSAEEAERLGEALSEAMRVLTPRQRQIVKCVAVGLSERATAEKLHIKNVSTVNEHLTRIRQKVLEYFKENATEFLPLVNGEKVRTAKIDRHKKANRHSAEYYKEYRARKKAEKQA